MYLTVERVSAQVVLSDITKLSFRHCRRNDVLPYCYLKHDCALKLQLTAKLIDAE
jgi:hypothetical protein